MGALSPDKKWDPLFRWLQAQRLCWVYLPVKPEQTPGFPQVLVFDVPRLARLGHVGTAIVFRDQGKKRWAQELPRWQAHWIAALVDRGWEVLVCRTARRSITLMRELGYEEDFTRS